MLISEFLPGASYSADAFTVPYSALNAVMTQPMTAGDSAEKLLYGLLEALKRSAISQPDAAMEVSSKSSGQSIWETTQGVFSDVKLVSYVVCFPFTPPPPTEDGDDLATVTG